MQPIINEYRYTYEDENKGPVGSHRKPEIDVPEVPCKKEGSKDDQNGTPVEILDLFTLHVDSKAFCQSA